ncbi:MAG: acetate kinase [Burkholderiaceae bacterium]|jgi:acetate kinase|nr:acetate kinase [Burkholderiaceae bacterium]
MSTTLSLVLNCGSSSLKFAIFQVGKEDVPIMSGMAECLGQDKASISFKQPDGNRKKTDLGKNAMHDAALTALIEELRACALLERVAAIGHRVVHGGNRFSGSVMITPDVIQGLEECSPLAPLHNPPQLVGIYAALSVFKNIPQIAVFDTAFHQSMKPAAYTYALPYKYLVENGVRRYGFHGTSHRYIAGEAVRVLNLDPEDSGLVIAHLGNGASVSAVRNGRCEDTSMGMTPLEGLVMGTRSGDVDFGALKYIAETTGASLDDLDKMLNKESGLLGISGLSNDCRELEQARARGHEGATLALDVFVHRLARHIGGHATSLKRLDALVFTGGIGENSVLIRELTLKHLEVFGFRIDAEKNASLVAGKGGVCTLPGGPVALVMATNEEGLIARDAAQLAGLAA